VQDFRCKAEQHALEQAPKEACGVLVNDTQFKLPWHIYLIPEDEWITIFPS
jgi:hypothetical protein